jgi:hypothetical protein
MKASHGRWKPLKPGSSESVGAAIHCEAVSDKSDLRDNHFIDPLPNRSPSPMLV